MVQVRYHLLSILRPAFVQLASGLNSVEVTGTIGGSFEGGGGRLGGGEGAGPSRS